MNIHRALSDVARIRAQLDRTEAYRGFRSTAVGFSVLALLAGIWAEQTWVEEPVFEVTRYLVIWFSVAIASGVFAATEMIVRGRSSQNRMVWKMHFALVRRLAPSLIVGFVLTLAIAAHALEMAFASVFESNIPEGGLVWALPGIWAMLYGLGLFSCEDHLPRHTNFIAAFLICSGIVVLATNWYTSNHYGWEMLVTFGVGQIGLSLLLYWNLERRNEK